MIRKIFIMLSMITVTLSAKAYEDCIVTNCGKLTDINIEDNTVIDVFPIVTIMNEKNTLIVHPLKSGQTRFCALKNGKNVVLFQVTVTDTETKINAPDGFEILSIDAPDDELEFEIDPPPEVKY